MTIIDEPIAYLTIGEIADERLDQNVTLPDDIQAIIALGQAAHKKNMSAPVCLPKAKTVPTIISIVDPDDQLRREDRLRSKAQKARGRRGQPPMTDRLRVVAIRVDDLERRGVPFATARNSRMNKAVRKWLNERMAKTKDRRKSRRKLITDDAVTILLKQVAELRK